MVSCLQDKTTDLEYLLAVNDAFDSLFRRRYCLIILSLDLVDTDTMSLLHTLRLHHTLPILALSENENIEIKTLALENGADGFITKPFDARECRATAHALIRRYIELGGDVKKPYAICAGGNLIIDPQYRCVTLDGSPIRLSRKEFDLLYFLVQHQRQVFSYEQIYSQIWNDDNMLDIEKTIRFHIQSLRKKLHFLTDIAGIETIWGIGYRFNPKPVK